MASAWTLGPLPVEPDIIIDFWIWLCWTHLEATLEASRHSASLLPSYLANALLWSGKIVSTLALNER